MNTLNFAITLLLAACGPVLAIRYLQPILLKVLRAQCPDGGEGAEFWLRCAYVLAVCGSLLLALSFGNYHDQDLPHTLERALQLVALGSFVAVAFIARQVWKPTRTALLHQRLRAEAALRQTPGSA